MLDTSDDTKSQVSSYRCSRLDLLCALLAFLLSLVLNLLGLTWGLPSPSRTEYYPRDIRWYSAPQNSSRLYETAPYESYNPDEGAILNALSNMRPSRFDFNPHYFNYPTLSIYLTRRGPKGKRGPGFREAREFEGILR